jgi:phage baseplate assembly protein W
MTDEGRVFGRGIGFPPQIGPDGRLTWSEGEKNIREAIQVILLTEPGERLRLAAFGGGLTALLFEPDNTTSRHLMAERIRRAVTDWEPRVQVQSVEVEADPDDPEAAIATVAYQLVATQVRATVTVPIAASG